MKNRFSFAPPLLPVAFFCLAAQAFGTPPSFAPIVKSEREKVVHISVVSKKRIQSNQFDPLFDRFFPQVPRQRIERASGSGFVISADGYIVTNNHVVENAEEVEVVLFDETVHKAKKVGSDARTDITLLKIEARGLPFVEFGDSDKLRVGDWVIAIGNPLGLENSVTAGIISAKGRDIFQGQAYGQFLQTDAAINFGNSGGPLLNSEGRVIGINTAIYAGGQSLAFAVPSNLAINIIGQLKEQGVVVRGWLGVGIEDLDDDKVEALDLKSKEGVAINSVTENSPAQKGGIREFDVIVEFDGKPVKKLKNLQQIVAETLPGKEVDVLVIREGEETELRVAVGKFEEEKPPDVMKTEFVHGMKLRPLDESLAKELGTDLREGLVVMDIDIDSRTAKKNIRKGDVIVKVNTIKVATVEDFARIIQRSKKASAMLLIKRNRGSLLVPIPTM